MDDSNEYDEYDEDEDEDEEDDYEYGVCPECNKPNTGEAWCKKCDAGKFLKEGKTSGNPEIDNLIYDSQLKVKHFYDWFLEWIPYDRFQYGVPF